MSSESNASVFVNLVEIFSPVENEVGLTYKVILIVQLGLVLPIGTFLHFGIIHFERFGADPMKRSLYNMLVSLLCIETVLIINMMMSITTVRFWNGTFSTGWAALISFATWFGVLRMSLVMLEICLVKNLQIYKYRLTASFSDEFLFQFFVAFNGVVASFWTLVDQKLSNLPDYDILS